MAHQIDFTPVGESSRSGDAIVLRFGNIQGSRNEQYIVVIDGGTLESGQGLVQHIGSHYGTDFVDLVISTHPDSDHSSGLSVVLEELNIGRLWMHRPWEHAEHIRNMFADPRLTDSSLESRLRRDLENARALETIANRKNIPIHEPFSGSDMGIANLWVLSPSIEYYRELLPNFRDTPDAREQPGMLQRAFQTAVDTAARWIDENWDIETLLDPTEEENSRSAENNSSVVLLVKTVDDKYMLLAGDAGVPALMRAAAQAETLGFHLPSTLDFMQIPHHGSRHNVGPTVLNRLLGDKGQLAYRPGRTAFVSCAAEGEPKHPSKRVINAFQRRGAIVHATQGSGKMNHHNAPRNGWSEAEPLPFYDRVEE